MSARNFTIYDLDPIFADRGRKMVGWYLDQPRLGNVERDAGTCNRTARGDGGNR